MSPILKGVVASQISGHLASPSSYESIATVTVGSGGQSTVSFSSIPSTYKHLQIRYIGRTSSNQNTIMRFNGDTGTNYSLHFLYGQGSSTGAAAETPQTYIYTDVLTGSTTGYTAAVIDILDYTSVNKNKTVRSLSGQDLNGTASYVFYSSGVWRNSSTAITSITFYGGANYDQYSSFALYGIKGA